MIKSIPLLFFGTSAWTVPVLEALMVDPRFQVVGVVTQPDRSAGRHAEPQASPVKHYATAHHVAVYQFEKVKSDEAYDILKTLNMDVAVLASFGQIIPQRIIDLYPHGIINIHPSLLPKYRGPAPIAAPIKQGDSITGVSIMKLDALMDHGPLLGQIEERIGLDDTAASLEQRLSKISATILPNILFQYVNGEIQPKDQDHTQATTVKMLSREDGLIDWNAFAQEIERTVRAYTPWPGTYTMVDGKRLKIFETKIGGQVNQLAGAKIVDDDQPAIVCGDGSALQLLRVQLEGSKPLSGVNFLRGKQNWGQAD